ncbi:MAG: hypothetical protein C5B50_29170 [Verrucomicrobia bacterium]|nr:MAG: hypothetical protein C5B50_29170 [Verrucomicrobiota bacterium]
MTPQSNNRQKLLLIVTGVIVGLFLGDLVILSPLIAAWKARSERLTQLTQKLNSDQLLLKREASLSRHWAEMQSRVLTNNTSAAEQQIFRAIDRWAQDAGVVIGAITPQWKRGDADDYMTYECRIDASGDLGRLTRFLHSAEREPMALKFESVELGSRDKEGQQLSLALQLSALILNPPPQVQ